MKLASAAPGMHPTYQHIYHLHLQFVKNPDSWAAFSSLQIYAKIY